jgi:hypothetical protein
VTGWEVERASAVKASSLVRRLKRPQIWLVSGGRRRVEGRKVE